MTRYLRISDRFNRRQYDLALAEAEACLDLFPNSPDWPYYAARCLEQLGRFDEALEALASVRYVDPAHRAVILTALGESSRVWDCLEASIDDLSETLVHPFYIPLRYDPYWDPLREDPRFGGLFRKLGIEP